MTTLAVRTYMLEGQPAAAGGAGSIVSTVAMLAIFLGVMYFFMIRPQRKQEKEIADMRSNLLIGDEITTNGGIIGRIVHIKDDIVTIETGADRVRIKVRKWAIATVDKKIDAKPEVPKGGFKVTGVKKSENKPELK